MVMKMPTVKLNTTPEPTKMRHFSPQTSCRNNQVMLPSGKKKPIIMARIMTSRTVDMLVMSSSSGLAEDGSSPALPSIHASSIPRIVSGEGMASEANRSVCMEANCVRSVEISDCVKPACRRRSKPRGRGFFHADAPGASLAPPSSGGFKASASSASRSAVLSSSPMEQLR
ncbi:hypothetical protein NLG97_g7736 [Lecanicillium saksenae]|uniref:Uncharacterized protein n=1 Tax=Lecanicillium saksenae TaxID=468837 RepID=A0ACC1QPT6_9HYPO|nr:hypothetical protein NLG97_g7736 [Lecanicillium saksenae]